MKPRCFSARFSEFFFTAVQSFDAKYYVVSVIDNIVNLQTNKYAYPSLYIDSNTGCTTEG